MSLPRNSRFAEICRDDPLNLNDAEFAVYRENLDRVSLACEQDIFIGVFFDGTNNNKFRDTPGKSHSNVARLYETFPGYVARQTMPALRPRVVKIDVKTDPKTGEKTAEKTTEERKVAPDENFFGDVGVENQPYYRKIYVPGVGTPHLDVGDDGKGDKKTGGLAFALLGQARMDWATIQLLNQAHAAITQQVAPPVDLDVLVKPKPNGAPVAATSAQREALAGLIADMNVAFVGPGEQLVGSLPDSVVKALMKFLGESAGVYAPSAFEQKLKLYEGALREALKKKQDCSKSTPRVRKVRLSVFGFSRGAAEARSWVNSLLARWPNQMLAAPHSTPSRDDGYPGLPFQIDFLGLFDTVASVGLAQSIPQMNGHFAWADGARLMIPRAVGRCVHLVSAHEVRGSFPLDSVCASGVLPSNCKEIVYPGMHSDVGGGYPPNDQGRAIGAPELADKKKLSQIPLAQMYREARMSGVPLAPPASMHKTKRSDFEIDATLKADFNAYVAATRSGTIPPTNGQGNKRFARMFPSETQPRENLEALVNTHASYLLQWRKAQISAGGIAQSVRDAAFTSATRAQDIEDLRGAEEELVGEVNFLRERSEAKFAYLRTDNPDLNDVYASSVGAPKVLQPLFGAYYASLVGTKLSYKEGHPEFIPLISLLGPVLGAVFTPIVGPLIAQFELLMREKQRQWDANLQSIWDAPRHLQGPQWEAASRLFSRYVHDSRAWFKPMFWRGHNWTTAPDDEDWFVLGGRLVAHEAEIILAERARAAARLPTSQIEAQRRLDEARAPESPLIRGAREPYTAWGYLRHRRIYQTGMLRHSSELGNPKPGEIDADERERTRLQLIEEENQAFARKKEPIYRARARGGLEIDKQYALDRATEEHEKEIARINATYGKR